MLYFDIAEPLKILENEEKGRLLDAMLDYGQFGVIPGFEGHLAIAWGFIRPKLDADAKSYRKKVVKNTYSSYCAKVKKNVNNIPLDFEEWCVKEGIDTTKWTQSVSTDVEQPPNTTPKPEIPLNINVTAAKKASTEGGEKGEEVPLNETEEQRRQRMIALLNNYIPG